MTSSSLLGFLLASRRKLFALICAGVASGLLSAALLALISRALSSGADATAVLIFAFVALTLGKVAANVSGQIMFARFAQGNLLDLSLKLSDKILKSPLRVVERRGSGQVLTTLTDDVSSVTWAVQCLPQIAMNAAVLIGCGLYLLWLSWQLLLGIACVIVLGALIYKLQHDRALKHIRRAREYRAALLRHFHSLTLGIKELMMHPEHRKFFIEREVQPAAAEYRSSNLVASRRYALADAWVQLLYHGLIGLVLFAVPAIARPSGEVLTGYVFAILYMMPPLWAIIGAAPAISRGRVALASIEALGAAMETEEREGPAQPDASRVGATVQLRGVTFKYDDESGKSTPFQLGPLDIELTPGEIVFVVGGNGSGKSTFIKLLTGLYAPASGELLLNGRPVTDESRQQYRDHFSVLFSDFHLFHDLRWLERPDLERAAREFLKTLRLESKVQIDGGRYSTLDLSQGQRKRLALVTAYLEDRPVYVFDEWASDQEPEYKRTFYETLLPQLRDRGKTVVVVSHDDRYFHVANRLYKLEDGHAGTSAGWAAVKSA